jgi:hypothetical protein
MAKKATGSPLPCADNPALDMATRGRHHSSSVIEPDEAALPSRHFDQWRVITLDRPNDDGPGLPMARATRPTIGSSAGRPKASGRISSMPWPRLIVSDVRRYKVLLGWLLYSATHCNCSRSR